MASDNPLVDPHSQFDIGEYSVDPDELKHGDISSLSPFTSGGDWLSGTGVYEDAEQIVTAILQGDVAKLPTDDAAFALDALGTVLDPIGTALSGLASWMIDHLKPLRFLLDELAGNPETIKGVAATWKNISEYLQKTAKEYAEAAGKETAHWSGSAADGYHDHASKLIEAAAAAGRLADGMSGLVKIAGEAVGFTRNTVRDLIANLVADLVEDAAEEAATWGAATPYVVEEATGQIARVTSLTTKEVKSLVDTLSTFQQVASEVNSVFGEIISILEDLPQASQAAH